MAPPPSTGVARSEAELISERPSSHSPGAFPRRLLLPGERILFETRPTLWGQRPVALGLLSVLLGLSAISLLGGLYLVETGPSTAPSVGAVFAAIGFVGGLLFGGLLGLLLRTHRATAYALTDRRVLFATGSWSTQFRFASWSEVVGLRPEGAARDSIVFEVQPAAGSDGTVPPARRIRWRALQAGPLVYEFVQAAFAFEGSRAAERERRLRQEAELRAGRIVCAFCGNPVATSEGGLPPTRCPRCSAPLTGGRAGPPAGSIPSSPWADDVGYLRPAVYLAREAIGWYRPVPILWAVSLLAFWALLVSVPTSGSGPGTVFGSALASLLAAIFFVYLLWVQALRKWSTVVGTIGASLPAGSPARRRLFGPLRRRLRFGAAGLLVSLVLLGASFPALDLFQGSAGATGGPSLLSVVSLAGAVGGAVSAMVLGQIALVSSYALVASGSDVRYIVDRLALGRLWATGGLLVAFWPVALVVIAYAGNSPGLALGPWMLAGILGPVGLSLGLVWTSEALVTWTYLADRYVGVDPEPTDELPEGARQGGALDGTEGEAAHGMLWAGAEAARWAGPWRLPALAAVVAVVAVGLLLASGLLGPWLPLVGSDRPPPVAPAPRVLVPEWANWTIPGEHYEAQSFPLTENATLTGRFQSSGLVDAYVMDSLDYVRWTVLGTTAGDRFSLLNATAGSLDLRLVPDDRWYVILANPSPTGSAEVTWTAECVVSS